MRAADRIRAHVVERYVDPARRRGDETITVVARDVLGALGLRGDHASSVCSALRAAKFHKENALVLIREDGPPSKQSTTTRFTYRLLAGSARGDDRPARNAVWDLLGSGKATFAALGGGDHWLTQEREAFHGSASGSQVANQQGSTD